MTLTIFGEKWEIKVIHEKKVPKTSWKLLPRKRGYLESSLGPFSGLRSSERLLSWPWHSQMMHIVFWGSMKFFFNPYAFMDIQGLFTLNEGNVIFEGKLVGKETLDASEVQFNIAGKSIGLLDAHSITGIFSADGKNYDVQMTAANAGCLSSSLNMRVPSPVEYINKRSIKLLI